jgi:hypothetical protein
MFLDLQMEYWGRTMQTPNTAAQIITSTGPRTIAGKRRSRRNAIKFGLFSKHLLLEGESRADFEKLLRGLREYWLPQGVQEEIHVERLASLYWRQRRVIPAESAIIGRSPRFVGVGTRPNSDLPSPLLLRAFSKDGMPFVSGKIALLRRALQGLFELGKNIIERGFDLDKDSEALGNIYDHSVCDEGFCADFAELITRASRYNLRDGEKISKKSLVDLCDLMDREACRLYELLRKLEADDVVFNSHAALLPPQPDLDRIIRSESRLSREIEREINLLERRQRARRGYPPPPTIKVDVN